MANYGRGTLKKRKGYCTLRLHDQRPDGTWGRVTHVIRQTTKRKIELEREHLVAERDRKLRLRRDRVDVVERNAATARTEHPNPTWPELRDFYLREKGEFYRGFSGRETFDTFFKALGNPRWSQFQTKHITMYRDQRREDGMCDVTISHELAMLGAIQTKGWKLGYLDKTFTVGWSVGDLLDAESLPYAPWHDWEVVLFVKHLPDWCGREIAFAALTGFRRDQIESMNWVTHLDVERGVLRPKRQKRGHQIELRLSTLPGVLRDLIDEQVEWSREQGFDVTNPEGFVFRRPASYKRGVRIGDWRKVWRRAFAACQAERADFAADLPDHRPGRQFHGLRSTAVTRLAAAGLQWKIISRLTGHRNPEMVSYYNRPGEEQFAADMERYDRHLRLVS